ncbi:MAG: hypothetical protein ACK40G_18255 [Cytophagaceae bacterium]
MILNFRNIIFSAFIGTLVACSPQFHSYNLAKEYASSLHYEEGYSEEKGGGQEEDSNAGLAGMIAKNFYGGDLKRGGLWFGGADLFLEKGDVFEIEAENVGGDAAPFGATFPPMDFIIEDVVIKISARAQGKDGSEPELHLQMDDASGNQTNAQRPSVKIENSEEFKDYYFSLKGIWQQEVPKKAKVNGAMINGIKFFVNPGQDGFSGMIYIEAIQIVPASEIEK